MIPVLNEKIAALIKPKSVACVGLDIGSHAIKCVEVIQDDKKRGLQSAQITHLSAGPDNLLAALRTVRQSLVSPAKHVRVSVSGPSVLIRNITLPRMTLQELKSAIRFEAERHIPFPVNECILDFQIMGQTANKPQMKVLLVAAKKDFINQQIKILTECDLEPEIIDADIFCFANAYEKLSEGNSVKTYGLLNIGHSLSSFAIIHEGEVFFVREMPYGGLGVTKALSELKNISEDAADQLKKKRDPDNSSELILAAQKGFESLVGELKRSIDYFENEAGEELKDIYLAGGGAKSQGAVELFSEELGKKVTLWNDVNRLEIAGDVDSKFLEQHFIELNVAYGLALRTIG